MIMMTGNTTNPLTVRLHNDFDMTWTEYAKENNISYGQLSHVINGRAQTQYIIEKLKADGLWWDTIKREEHAK
jgi:predicted transcriptional regulator